MKHYPIYIALALLCSCSALQEEYQDPEAGKEIKLEVAFADASTKASYALENNSLKCSWEAGDSISVISLHNGAIASVNVFTTEAGGRTASFSGRYTGQFTDPVIALYPAVKGSQQQGNYSRALQGNQTGMIYVRKGESVLHFSPDRDYIFSQESNASYAHIPMSEVMTGSVDLNTNGGSVSMNKHISVLKLTLSLPELPSGEKVRSVTLSLPGATPFTNQSATLSLASPSDSWTTTQPCDSTTLSLGAVNYGISSGFTCSGHTLTAYLPVFPSTATAALQGDAARTLTITVSSDLSIYSAQKVIPAKSGSDYAYSLSNGSLNTLTATLARTADVDPQLTYWLRNIETLADVDAAAATLRNEILNTASDLSSITGTTYYVSEAGSDNNSGLSPAAPVKTLGKVNSLTLQPGDGVLFRRGDLWRGCIKVKDGVTYSAYGEGPKPRFYNSIDVAKEGSWTYKGNNIYQYSQTIPHSEDVGNLIFNDGADGCAYKVVLRRDYLGNGYHPDTMQPFSGWQDLSRDRDMFHDKNTGKLYLCSTAGNPATRWTSIEAAKKGNTFDGFNNNWISCVIDNLCIKYTGSHGVGMGHVNQLTVTNCEIGWIGGSLQNDNGDDILPNPGEYSRPVRYGNGVEIWGVCNSFKVAHNYIHQVYDAAISPQYKTESTAFGELLFKNVSFTDNLIEKSVYAIEYWISVPSEKDLQSGFRDFLIRGNIMRMAGEYGWGYQRFNKEVPVIIQTGNSHHNYAVGFRIEGNIIDRGKPQLLRIMAGRPEWLPECRANVYLQEQGVPVGDMLETNPKMILL